MRRLTPLIILCICCTGFSRTEGEFLHEMTLQAEYREDALDYDESEKKFFREKFSYAFRKKSSLNAAHVYIQEDEDNRYTWNLSLLDQSPYFQCILGNFSINFGAGLMIGKKQFINPDIFSSRLIVSREAPFAPCNSGNPLYSFHGIAAGTSLSFAQCSLSLHGFYSFRNRFIRDGDYDLSATESSINSINQRYRKDYRYREPVIINDYGCAAIIKISKKFTLQAYALLSDLKKPGGENLIWRYNDRYGMPFGEELFFCYGFFGEYSDRYMTIFCEVGLPGKVIKYSAGIKRIVGSYGCLFGLRFRHSFIRLSISGKITDNKFFSNYSSGSGSPETSWTTSIVLMPTKKLSMGATFFSNKKISPSYNDSYLRWKKKEMAMIKYNFTGHGLIKIAASHLKYCTDSSIKEHCQIKSLLKINPIKEHLSLKASATYQTKKHYGSSWNISPALTLHFLKYVHCSVRYARFTTARENSLFASTPSFQDSISPGFFVESVSNIISGRLSIKWNRSIISAGYLHHFAGGKSLRSRIEIMGRIVF